MSDKKYPLISVVVPVYNVEKYLDRCIGTLCSQTYSNYEVILVDDGSKDESGKICDRYQKQNSCIRVFHKTNGGVSDARNYGVSQSEGEYIIFVDPDDYVSKSYVENLYQMLWTYQADMAVLRACEVEEQKEKVEFEQGDVLSGCRCLNAEEALEEMLYCKWGVVPWGKIYKKELVVKYPYPVGVIYEDLATTYKIVGDCKKVVATNKVDYAYVHRKGSITHSRITEWHLQGLTWAKEQIDYIKRYYPALYSAAQYRFTVLAVGFISCILDRTREDRKFFVLLQNELKPYYGAVLRDKKVAMIRKIKLITIRLGYFPTFLLWKAIAFFREKERKIKEEGE